MQEKSPRYLINVPQGRSARFVKCITEFYGIEGGYTDNFSTCNIVVCIGQDRFTLTHVDTEVDLEILKKEIQWVGQKSQLIVLNRKEGSLVEGKIIECFQKDFPHMEVKEVNKEVYGLAVYFNSVKEVQEIGFIHAQIQTFSVGKYPKKLLRHPLEEKFLSLYILKICISSFFIGKFKPVASLILEDIKKLQLVIFDSYTWVTISPDELKISSSTRKALIFLGIEKTDSEFEILEKLKDKIQKIYINIANLNVDNKTILDVVSNITFHVSYYFNNFKTEFIFKKSVTRLVEVLEKNPNLIFSEEDKKFRKELEIAIEDSNKKFDEIDTLIMNFKESSGNSVYKKLILETYEKIIRMHYLYRAPYQKINRVNQERLAFFQRKNAEVISSFENKNYKLAKTIAIEMLKLATWGCQKNNDILATAYFIYGNALFSNGEFKDAERFLIICSNLIKDVFPPDTGEMKEMVEEALTACRSKIMEFEAFSVNVFSSPLSNIPTTIVNKEEMLSELNTGVASNITTVDTTVATSGEVQTRCRISS